jgi:predicted DNA-binding protein
VSIALNATAFSQSRSSISGKIGLPSRSTRKAISTPIGRHPLRRALEREHDRRDHTIRAIDGRPADLVRAPMVRASGHETVGIRLEVQHIWRSVYRPGMVRTQIQLTEEQARKLERLSARSGKSMAALIREAVDRLEDEADRERRWQQALAAIRRSRGSGLRDLARGHDTYLAEDLRA